MTANAQDTDAGAAPVWIASLAYTAFVIYGSLVPLDFHALPWTLALERFRAIPFLDLGIGSRADWVANLLLFMPLSYLWLTALVAGRSVAVRLAASAMLVPAAILLSVGIEFTQLFFPPRTVSQNDIFAESLGALLGVIVWWATQRRFRAWLGEWQRTHARAALAERLAGVYFVALLVYNLLPLDLTISAVEIFHKWREGKVNLLPFARLPHDPASALYEIATDVLIWMPLAWLWAADGSRSRQRAWAMTVGAAAGIEFLQLFVYSRVSDVTDIVSAAVGATIGVGLGRGFFHAAPASVAHPRSWMPFALAAAWVVVLFLVFWYPFDFRHDGAYLAMRLEAMPRVPFTAYYYGTEFRAATEFLHKILFFAPLGGLLAFGVRALAWRYRAIAAGLAIAGLLLLPALIEAGQLLLPGKNADPTDAFLEALGGLTGYAVARLLLRAPRSAAVRPTTHAEHGAAAPGHVPVWHFPAWVAVMTLVLRLATQLPGVPYNVRELLDPAAPWLSACALAVTIYWVAAFPVWLARRPWHAARRWLALPAALAGYGLVAFVLLDVAVPDESLFDLAGSPILGWPGRSELALRWVALALVPGSLIHLAVLIVRRLRGLALRFAHFAAVVPPLVVAYWGIFMQAATDNLTELVAAPQPLGFVLLCSGFLAIFVAAAALASPWRGAAKWAIALASVPLAGACFALGLAADIDKYGQHFSAAQFLLSRDRQHYASGVVIGLRYAIAHVAALLFLATVQWPWLRRRGQANGSFHANH